MSELLPCPSCISDSVLIPNDVTDEYDGYFFVTCLNDECSMQGPEKRLRTLAISNWNDLPRAPSPREKRLEKALREIADNKMDDGYLMSAADIVCAMIKHARRALEQTEGE